MSGKKRGREWSRKGLAARRECGGGQNPLGVSRPSPKTLLSLLSATNCIDTLGKARRKKNGKAQNKDANTPSPSPNK
jgi:hypothetical protein